MLKLYSFWRSSSAYRVRIALNLKGLEYLIEPVHLMHEGGQQFRSEYRRLNPQAMVPLLVDGELRISQSLAILDYLEALTPRPPLLPTEPALRARVLEACLNIVSDVQPLQNSRVLRHLQDDLAQDDARQQAWVRHWVTLGLDALETRLQAHPQSRFSFGETPGFADCCLVPQLYSARRFDCELTRWPRLTEIESACQALPAFVHAQPDHQPDAPTPQH